MTNLLRFLADLLVVAVRVFVATIAQLFANAVYDHMRGHNDNAYAPGVNVFSFLKRISSGSSPALPRTVELGFMPYGDNKIDGSHDHRGNKGDDRTPAQKRGDRARSEPRR